VVFVGGGVPKNFIQQTKVVAFLLGNDRGGHTYAIQYTIDPPHFGGLSGCTFSEAVSWGKVAKSARMAQVFVDATIALPLVAHSLRESAKRERCPVFSWKGSELSLHYETR
jgi:deoxyhypusine synthase